VARSEELHDAIVLRSVSYGDADIVAWLFTRTRGRVNAIARGARRGKSRLGGRLEPYMTISVRLRRGRGDLDIVAGIDKVRDAPAIRARYDLQQIAAAALDTLGKISATGDADERAWHLSDRFLQLLAAGVDHDSAEVLLAAYRLKLLHVVGFAPQLDRCVRCGSVDDLGGWSPAEGGVVCDSCQAPGDRTIDADAVEQAALLISTPFAELPGEVTATAAQRVTSVIIGPVCEYHAGFQLARR
jgi:DNA repair protein RecO (recombination protein O)